MLTAERLKLKREMAEERPSIWIGKNGVTEEVIKEVPKQLEKNEVVKIKIQKAILQTSSVKDLSSEIAEKTSSSIIDIRGRSFTLYKEKKEL